MTKKTASINGLARADDFVPPARLLAPIIPQRSFGPAVPAGRMGVSGQGVADQNRIVPARGQLPVSFKFNFHRIQSASGFKGQRIVLGKKRHPLSLDIAHRLRMVRPMDRFGGWPVNTHAPTPPFIRMIIMRIEDFVHASTRADLNSSPAEADPVTLYIRKIQAGHLQINN